MQTWAAVLIFLGVIVSFTVQTEVSKYIQSDKGYTQPYFLLWLGHSGYVLIAPVHYLGLKMANIPLAPLMDQVQSALSDQFPEEAVSGPLTLLKRWAQRYNHVAGFPLWPYLRTILILTVLVASPALCWYVAVPLTSMTDITALYNSNAFWAYIIAAFVFKTEVHYFRKTLSVILACLGVFVIAYGDSGATEDEPAVGIGSRLLGNLLALSGSIFFGFYEVWYQINVSLEAAAITEELQEEQHRAHSGSRRPSRNYLLPNSPASGSNYSGLPPSPVDELEGVDAAKGDDDAQGYKPAPDSAFSILPSYVDENGKLDSNVFLLHANTITASIGICTFLLLWIPIPLLHFLGFEPFRLPPDWTSVGAIFANVCCGVIFNAGFMMLISLYGAVLSAVGALMTVVSVALSDWLFRGVSLSLASLSGSALIVFGFSILALSAFQTRGHGQNQHLNRTTTNPVNDMA